MRLSPVIGCIYLLSMYYKRYELQLRVNLFFSASILAGAFSGVSKSPGTRFSALTRRSCLRMQLPIWPVLLAMVAGGGSSFWKASLLASLLPSHGGSFQTGRSWPDSSL